MNYRGRTLKVAQLVSAKDGVLRGHRFESCLLEGPAVLHLGEDVVLEGNTFPLPDGNVESILWDIAPNRPYVIGAVHVQKCTFTDCSFKQIGFTGPKETLDEFRADLG